jgi:hypothetical protein
MTARDEFAKELRAGRYQRALAAALQDAVELHVVTWVSGRDRYDLDADSDQPIPGQRMQTRINIVSGDVENEIGREFLDGPYQELRGFHAGQVKRGFDIIHENLQTVQHLFKVLMQVRQGGQATPLQTGAVDLPAYDLDGGAEPMDESWIEAEDAWAGAIAPAQGQEPDGFYDSGVDDGDGGMFGDGPVQSRAWEPDRLASRSPEDLESDLEFGDLLFNAPGVSESVNGTGDKTEDHPSPRLADDPDLGDLAFSGPTLPSLDDTDHLFDHPHLDPIPGDDLNVDDLLYDAPLADGGEESTPAGPDAGETPADVLHDDPELADLAYWVEGEGFDPLEPAESTDATEVAVDYRDPGLSESDPFSLGDGPGHGDRDRADTGDDWGAAVTAPEESDLDPSQTEAIALDRIDIPEGLQIQLEAAAIQVDQEPRVAMDVAEELHLLERDLLNHYTDADLELMVEPGDRATNLRSLAEMTPLHPRSGGTPVIPEPMDSASDPMPDDAIDSLEPSAAALLEDGAAAFEPPREQDVLQTLTSDPGIDLGAIASEVPREMLDLESDQAEMEQVLQTLTSDVGIDDLEFDSDPVLLDLNPIESDEAVEMSEEEFSTLIELEEPNLAAPPMDALQEPEPVSLDGAEAGGEDGPDSLKSLNPPEADFAVDSPSNEPPFDLDDLEDEFTSMEVTADALDDFQVFLAGMDDPMEEDAPAVEADGVDLLNLPMPEETDAMADNWFDPDAVDGDDDEDDLAIAAEMAAVDPVVLPDDADGPQEWLNLDELDLDELAPDGSGDAGGDGEALNLDEADDVPMDDLMAQINALDGDDAAAPDAIPEEDILPDLDNTDPLGLFDDVELDPAELPVQTDGDNLLLDLHDELTSAEQQLETLLEQSTAEDEFDALFDPGPVEEESDRPDGIPPQAGESGPSNMPDPWEDLNA